MFTVTDPNAITLDVLRTWFGPLASALAAPGTFFNLLPGESLTISSGQTVGKAGLSAEARIYQTAYAVSRAFYDGDHWQGGQGWAGAFPLKPGTNAQDPEAVARMAAAFTSENVIATVADRHTAAVVGRSPQRRLATDGFDGEPDKDPLAARNVALEAWGARRNVLSILTDYTLALLLGGSASVTLWIPPAVAARAAGIDLTTLAEGDAIALPSMSYDDALALLRPAYVTPGEGGVFEDPETGDRYSGVLRKSADGSDRGEVAYLDANGRTVVTLLIGEKRFPAPAVDLGGALPTYARRRRALITEQVRQQQRLVNKAYTMANTNLDWSGFLERIVLNGKPPTEKGEDGIERPAYRPGPGTATFLAGNVFTDADGNEKMATPSVVFREPGAPIVFSATVEMGITAIYRETNQLHALNVGDAGLAAESRIQAKADFIVSLLMTKPAADGAGRHLYETADRWACAISGEPAQTGTHTFRTRLDPGPISPAEIAAVVSKVKEGLQSRRSGLAELRTEDVEAELLAIEAEAYGSPEARARAVAGFVNAGMSLYNALDAAGYSEDEAKALADVTRGGAPVEP